MTLKSKGTDQIRKYRKYAARALFLIAFVFCGPSLSAAPVGTDLKYLYYDINIRGLSEEEIENAALMASPVMQNGQKLLSGIDCDANISGDTRKNSDDSCAFANFKVASVCTLTRPRFVGGGEATKKRLDDFLTALETAEQDLVGIFNERLARFTLWLEEEPVFQCASIASDLKKAFDLAVAEGQAAMSAKAAESNAGPLRSIWSARPGSGASASGQVEPEIKYAYHEVPLGDQGTDGKWKRDFGQSEWAVKYDYRPKEADGKCELEKFDVSVICYLDLPRFIGGQESLRPELEAQEKKAKQLHLDRCHLVAEEASGFAGRVRGIGPLDCGGLQDTVKSLYQAAMEKARDRVTEYDQNNIPADDEAGKGGPAENKEIKREVKYKYYDVKIKAGEQVEEAALRGARYRRDDQPSLSSLQWSAAYQADPKKRNDGTCGVLDYEITLKFEITLPKFKCEDKKDEEKAAALLERIKADEERRCALIEAEALKFSAWLAEDRSFQCGPMSNLIRGEFNRWMAATKEALKTFDASKT